MRKQIAAANWKMNLSAANAETLLADILQSDIEPGTDQEVIFSVPFPYLAMAQSKIAGRPRYFIAAQNCSDKRSGAYTGETSVEMLQSLGISRCIVGHSERREYFKETNQVLAEKLNRCFDYAITPIFCCGEALDIRDRGDQNAFVQTQLEESLFHLSADQIQNTIIAYEPIWAIGTGRTASTAQAQEMQQHLRAVLAGKWGNGVADNVSILYGGSVKASNAPEIFAAPDVDGGLVGGASLQAGEFISIIKALKQ